MGTEKYAPLKAYVLRRGSMRLALHGPLRDRLVEQVVEEWPVGCPPDRIEEVLRARMSVRLRGQHGSVIAVVLLSTLANLIIRLVVEWWFSRESHQVLLYGWARQAQRPAD